VGIQTQKKLKKQEKLISELEKLLDAEKQKLSKSSGYGKKAQEEIRQLERDVKERDGEIAKLKVGFFAFSLPVF
jgi:hypothetical protein